MRFRYFRVLVLLEIFLGNNSCDEDEMWMKMRMKTKMGREKGNYENKVIIFVINYLLTESEIFTVKYQTQV